MDKRGQIYILVALVMSIVVFGLISITNQTRQENLKSDFQDLSENYAQESTRLVNSLLATGKTDIEVEFTQFSQLFTSYSKTQTPDFGLIYAFNYQDRLYVGNYLKEEILISWLGNSPVEVSGCYSAIPASVGFDGISLAVDPEVIDTLGGCTFIQEFPLGAPSSIDLVIGEDQIPYTFTLKKDQPEIIMVSWESKGNQRKVFTEGDLVHGEVE